MLLTAKGPLGCLALLAAVALVGAVLAAPIEWAPVVLLSVGAMALVAAWTARGDLLTAILVWFLAVICFDEEFWRVDVPFFFNLTISRILIVVLGMVWMGMWVMGRTRLRTSSPVLQIMAVILVYFTLSAAITGFETVAIATVHYRLIGGFWFAFAMYFFVLHAVQTETHVMRLLKFFCLIGLYLTITGWCEHFGIWELVFPRYIGDAERGIHWGRVRGPFLVSPTMGVALTFCFFSNLVLARKVRGYVGTTVYLLSALMLPVLFWTQTRSVWLSVVLGTLIWMLYTRRRWAKVIVVGAVISVCAIVATANIENIMSEDRERGGVADPVPIYVRIGLAYITWDMFNDYPLFGVGFGHFRDEAPAYARDVVSPFYYFASSAMEHNNFLSLLAETGFVGLLLYVLLLLAILRMSIQLYRRIPASAPGPIGSDLLVLYWVLFMVHIVDGMFRETSVHPFSNCLFFGVAGVVGALEYLLRPQPIPQRAPWVAAPRVVGAAPVLGAAAETGG